MPEPSATFQSDAEIRAAIKGIVSAVTGYGTWLDRWGQKPGWATETGAAGGPFWYIRRTAEESDWPDVALNDLEGDEAERKATYQFVLYYPFTLDEDDDEADPSEPKFDTLVDAVIAEFEDKPNLNGAVYSASLVKFASPPPGFVALQVGEGLMVCHHGTFDIEITQYRPLV